MYNERLESLIEVALADGVLTEKEKQVLYRNAQAMGVDLDEFEMVLEARLYEKRKAMQQELAAEKAASAHKSEKFGEVRKCPRCGAVAMTMTVICPECGYEFCGIGANSSSQKLASLLQKVDDELKTKGYEKKRSFWDDDGLTPAERIELESYLLKAPIITSFPVPNTKEDLLEFAITMRTGMNTYSTAKTNFFNEPWNIDELKKIEQAYISKYEECVLKMSLMFPNDPHFKKFIEEQSPKEKEKEKGGFFGKLFK